MAWKGRQLTGYAKNGTMSTFTYDADGLRGSKTVGGVKTVYQYVGDKLYYEKRGNSQEFYYFYDSYGNLATIYYGTSSSRAIYHTLTNAQGDVIAIYNNTGALVARYEYDAWGNILSVTDANGNAITQWYHIANANPIRYRGYYYDDDLGLYYLQSRYYDSETGRFINADNQTSGVGGDVLGYNMFAYCTNNPVNLSDGSGHWPSWATKLIIGTAVIAVAAVLTIATAGTGTALACFAVGALKGAVVGAAMGAASGAVTGAVGHRITTGSWEGAGQAALEGAADGYMSGAISGFVSGGMSSNACFVAGTSILTAAGYVAIENIKEDDYVWASDPETGEKALKRVVQTFVNESDELVHVFVNGEEIITTPEHPFYVPQKGWVGSIRLRAGDILILQNGQYVIVEKVQHEILEVPITVYNFEVEDFHTYYVGESSVLVHNECYQKHHMLTNKSKKYTPKFKQITDKYGLDLNESWNIKKVSNHMGRHTNSYHEFMLENVSKLDAQANGNISIFEKGFKELAEYVSSNPSILYNK